MIKNQRPAQYYHMLNTVKYHHLHLSLYFHSADTNYKYYWFDTVYRTGMPISPWCPLVALVMATARRTRPPTFGGSANPYPWPHKHGGRLMYPGSANRGLGFSCPNTERWSQISSPVSL